jgi:anti-sigma factor RsiW
MTCEAYEDLVAAHVDGVLSSAETHEVTTHLASCTSCQRLFTEQSQFRHAFAARRLVVPIPPAVEQQLRQTLKAERLNGSTWWERLSTLFWQPRFAIGFAAAIILVAFLFPRFFPSTPEPGLFSQAVASYRRLADASAPLAYEATDPNQLAAAFNLSGQLDFVTQVTDFQPAGYQLRGGMVAKIANQPAAIAVYDRKEDDHIVCLRLGGKLPTMPPGAEFIHNHHVYTHDGYTVVYSQFRRHYCVLVSRLPRDIFLQRLGMAPGA